MKTKISHSALNKYLQCPRLYKHHYVDRLRGKTISGALLVGSAIDKSLNELLISKDLKKAIEVFDKEFEFGYINDKRVHLRQSEQIVYAKKDIDWELLHEEDLKELNHYPFIGGKTAYDNILDSKETNGFENLKDLEKRYYNNANWLCLRRKSHLMLKAYAEKVLPKIKKVIEIQKRVLLAGKTGDEIEMYIDLIVEWEDGKKYVLDNKTSTMQYEQDSASTSQQLIIYYYAVNKELPEQEKLDGVGFIVMNKQIQKNRIKICEKCGYNGTGGRHKTCDKNVIGPMGHDERCNGEWKETINPECKIDIILNQVTLPAQNLIVQSFKEANEGIKAGIFPPNVDSCEKYGVKCAMYNKCWNGKDDDLIKLEEKIEKK